MPHDPTPFRPRRQTTRLVVLLGLLAATASAMGQEDDAIRIRLRPDPGPYFVGQGINLVLATSGQDTRPTLELPKLADAMLWTAQTSFRPINETAIGDKVVGENLFFTQLRVVAARPGSLEIPPVTARLGVRQGKSPPVKLTIQPVPAEGRPSSFLGGVGDFRVSASASASSVKVGQVITYEIKIEGPGAWGATVSPELKRLDRLAFAPRVELASSSLTQEPPVRVISYRIRPMKAGSAALPPVSISAYDPKLRRYLTRATSSVPLNVIAVRAFDPGTLAYEAPASASSAVRTFWLAIVPIALILLLVSALLIRTVRRGKHGRERSDRRAAASFARRFPRTLQPPGSPADGPALRAFAQQVVEGLITYTELGQGRPPGAMTPDEARNAIRELTRSEGAASQAEEVMDLCDRIQFSGRPNAEIQSEVNLLARSARELFRALGRGRLVFSAPRTK